ncbi:MAG TPA: DUF2917 domain-containing protein [Tepidisphaeraceae bacterium]|jgi:hypothetical protein|nr:DUF2917 domain-containing protein [Tepidisphaeraceae bacterium]
MTKAPHQPRFDCPAACDVPQEAVPCSFVCLSTGSAWTVTRGVRQIRCVRGTVWITQANDARDHVLIEGQTFDVRHATVAVQALVDSMIRI